MSKNQILDLFTTDGRKTPTDVARDVAPSGGKVGMRVDFADNPSPYSGSPLYGKIHVLYEFLSLVSVNGQFFVFMGEYNI